MLVSLVADSMSVHLTDLGVMQDSLAFVGLGAMGKRMAANLARYLAQSGQVRVHHS
jgi:hypothetical protein